MRKAVIGLLLLLIAIPAFALTACGGSDGITDAIDKVKTSIGGVKESVEEDKDAPDRDNTPKVLDDSASGKKTFDGNGATVDYSNAAQGYIEVKYEGDNPKIKVQIAFSGEDPYTYDLQSDKGFNAFPLSRGEGEYKIGVYENVEGDKYATAAEKTIKAKIKDPLSPFLHPNQYANFNSGSACVAKAEEVCKGVKSDNGATERIFLFVVGAVSYDFEKAKTVQSGYVPDPDETLSSGTGICFDYASLTTSMLRSQGIPCQLIVGYAGSAYHAWIGVYSTESGKIASIITFDADQYNLMDPTFTASGDKADPNLVGDGSQYNPMFYY